MAGYLKFVDHCRWMWQIDGLHIVIHMAGNNVYGWCFRDSSVIVKYLAEVPAAGGVITF